MKVLIIAGIVALIILWPVMKMAGICSRQEEREWEDDRS